MDDSIKGMSFINDSNGKYEIVIGKNNNGYFSANLIKNDSNGTSVVIPLNMSDIYAQCAPSKIIESLVCNIQDIHEVIAEIRDDSHIHIDTPDKIPF